MTFNLTPNVDVQRDARGRIEQLTHIFEPYTDPRKRAETRTLATAYLQDVREIYGIDPAWLANLKSEPARSPQSAATELRFAEQKELLGTTTVSFAQTERGIPVWEAGFTVVMQASPLRVTGSHSTLHEKVDAEPVDDSSPFSPDKIDEERLAKALGLSRKLARAIKINQRRWRIYQYLEDERLHVEVRLAAQQKSDRFSKASPPPTLAVPPPREVKEGQHYLVTEVLFTVPVPSWGDIPWRVFVEVRNGAVLYIRALVACVSGQVFSRDPQSRSGAATVVATATDAVLNPWRELLTLPGLTAPGPGTEQALTGEFVSVLDVELPTLAPPTRPAGSNFDFDVRSDGFAATNAYFLVDGLFRLMQSMGFTIAGPTGYFDGTTFPVPVDHRGLEGDVNAHCLANATGDGIGQFAFGPCVAGTTVGMCTEFQTVAHEFSHALLEDIVHLPNFDFCHSAGDSLATIMNDPDTVVTSAQRFQVFPWCPIGGAGERFCNRDVAAGWAWGGSQDNHGYGSEQILATTLFRVYQVTGGDSTHPDPTVRRATKLQAARYACYLIFRSIGALATSPVTATPNVGIYATALMNADTGTASFDGLPGGTHNKVLRWSFERQGWYQPPGAPSPVTTPGAAPAVDVYIDDGRAGVYSPYLEDFWETTDIWNLTAPNPATTPADHTEPILGVPNFCYVRVRNRGTAAANNVTVHGYHNRPSTGLMWPGDWQSMTTAVLPAAGSPALSIPSLGMVTVGPFEWTPEIEGHECLMFWVSADGDRANIDPATGFSCATGPTPHWRFVPFDNNVAQRNVAPAAARSAGLREEFADKRFWVENTTKSRQRMRIEVVLPPLLSRRGWMGSIEGADQGGLITLKAREKRKLRIMLKPGKAFTRDDVLRAKGGLRIRVRSIVDGIVTGGISYELDPTPRRRVKTKPQPT